MKPLALPAGLFAALTAAAACAGALVDERRSGYELMNPEIRAMQDDDAANPGMLWVLEGESLWNARAGAAGEACASCHGDAAKSMKGVAARYPAFDAARDRPIGLAQRINACRVKHQQASALPYEGRDLLSLTAYVANQSRGMPISISSDGKTRSFVKAGEAEFHRRQGQLNLSCAQCHDANAGRRLGGSLIPQAHPTGYPIYRLEWQDLGSLERRLRGCMTGIRAEPYPYGALESVELQLYLLWRARGMPLETPAVRP